MSSEYDNLSEIFKNYPDIEKVVLLEKDEIIEINHLILYGKINDEDIDSLKSQKEFENYHIVSFDSIKDRKFKKYMKQNGYYIYKKEVREFINYCNRLYMKKESV